MPPITKWFDPAKGCEVPMPRWAVAARQGLDRMGRLVSALPLSEALRRSCSIFNSCRLKVSIIRESGNSQERVLIGGRAKKEYPFLEFLLILSVLNKGGPLDACYNYNAGMLIKFAQNIPIIIGKPKDNSAAARIRSLNDAIVDYRKTLLEISARTFAMTNESFLQVVGKSGRSDVASMHREMAEDVSYGTDICVAMSLLKPVSASLSVEDTHLLADFIEHSNEPVVQEYASLLSRISRERGKCSFDYLLIRRKFELACPDAVEMLRAQSEIPQKEKPVTYTIESGRFQPASPESLPIRIEREDAEYIRTHFPRLYKMMARPTDVELARRDYGLKLRRLIRHGVLPEFIRECIAEGIRDISAIESLYTTSPHQGAQAASRIRSTTLTYPCHSDLAVTVLSPLLLSYDDFLSNIMFSQEIQNHIRDNGDGLTPRDIVFAICKGFNLGGGKAAVGGAHVRGSLIRRNIRRCGLDDAKVIGFLDSLNLVIHHAGSARTKDDAMSINIHPDNEIGKEIIRTISDAFLWLRQAGRTNGTSVDICENGQLGIGAKYRK